MSATKSKKGKENRNKDKDTDGVGSLVKMLGATSISISVPGNPENPKNPKKPKGNKKKKTLTKTVGDFECTSDSCKKNWTSAHAWGPNRVQCELCQSKAKIVMAVDEICVLDSYSCATPDCNNFWQCIHDDALETLQMECDLCKHPVNKESNVQERFGRHFFYECLNKQECGSEWEDFTSGRTYSQRCTKCGSAGQLKRTRNVAPKQFFSHNNGRRGNSFGFGSGGGHNVDGCDMCQEVKRSGIGHRCTPYRKAEFKTYEGEDGEYVEQLVGMTK